MNPIIIILSVVLVLLTGLFFLKYKLVHVMHLALKLLFPLLLIAAISALFLPQIYSTLADTSLQGAGILTRIQELDQSIKSVSDLPQNILNDLQNLVGNKSNTDSGSQPGLVEKQLYPTLVSVLAIAYRAIVEILAIAGMSSIVYLSYTTSSLDEVGVLKHKYNELDNRLHKLESGSDSAT